MILTENRLKESLDFLKEINHEDEVVIVHHWDMDGVASATTISKMLINLREKKADRVKIPEGRTRKLDEKEEENLRKKDKVIILDFLPTEEPELENQQLLVIDHHGIPDNYTTSENETYLNPRLWDETAYIPCSKITNLLAGELDQNYDWIAGLGILQDFAVNSNLELFYRLKNKYDRFFPAKEKINQKSAKESKYGNISSILNIKPYKETQKNSDRAYNLLIKAKDLTRVKSYPEYDQIKKVYDEMCQEYRKIIDSFEEKKESYPSKGLTFFEFKSEFYLNSSIATHLSIDETNHVYIIIRLEKSEDLSFVNISARAQSGNVDLSKLLNKATPESGSSGGHKKAAGARFKARKLREFKESIINQL